MKMTTPAKTVADCFRYRRHVGLDVALAAIREYVALSRRRDKPAGVTIDALWNAAKADRVSTVLRPYIEALTSR